VEAAAATYLVYYRHHLATEESKVLPRAAELLTREDWVATREAVGDAPDAMSGADFGERYRELRKFVALHAARSGKA
jgi:hemerythrin-like domain-containing protein